MKAVTVKDLYEQCKHLVGNGYGNKVILLSDDDEGNGFHTMFYTFEIDQDSINEFARQGLFHDDNDPSTVVILG